MIKTSIDYFWANGKVEIFVIDVQGDSLDKWYEVVLDRTTGKYKWCKVEDTYNGKLVRTEVKIEKIPAWALQQFMRAKQIQLLIKQVSSIVTDELQKRDKDLKQIAGRLQLP